MKKAALLLMALVLCCGTPIVLAREQPLTGMPERGETGLPLPVHSRMNLPISVTGTVVEAGERRMVVRFDWQLSGTRSFTAEDLLAVSWESGTGVVAWSPGGVMTMTLDYYTENGLYLESQQIPLRGTTPMHTGTNVVPFALPHGTGRKYALSGSFTATAEAVGTLPLEQVAFTFRYARPPAGVKAEQLRSWPWSGGETVPRLGLPISAASSFLLVNADGTADGI